MNASPELSIIHLVLNASLLVQAVMAILAIMSLGSWTTIFRKLMQLRQTSDQTHRFEEEFWSGGDLGKLYQRVHARRAEAGTLERIFDAGMGEFLKWRQSPGADPAAMLDGTRRAMRVAFQRELDALERGLPFLANVGSVSPYIGLFGTVWGIMHAFVGLSNVQQATLASVAPGIAEALVATAIGLFAAIPAFVAYNRFTADVDRLANRLDNFVDEFSNVLLRQK
ncbi:protein TolQ [Derxia gummosa]|uniref:Tol-Pal system protein TolQ n=1 Tax=Derxia gummosa DSM 723 TaxID=1121388 RepID=A0A8B6X6R1_9BURK|nr:protein TolQ [Derxia gummosa]